MLFIRMQLPDVFKEDCSRCPERFDLAWKSHEPKHSRDFQAEEPLGKRLGVKMYFKTSETA
jgi:hypothetical protein